VKEAVLPFSRFPGVDTILGPEMRSTGEVMGWDRDFPRAFLKSQLAAGTLLPTGGAVFFSMKDDDKMPQLIETARILVDLGFSITATRGTAGFLSDAGIRTTRILKAFEGRPNIIDALKDGTIALVMNTTEGAQAVEDSRSMRNVALMGGVPYYTTAAASHAAAQAMKVRHEGDFGVRSLQG